jgi:hypothetical protein
LNAVLEKGATVVAQAAGVNDQAADSIDRMNVALTDAGNAAKAVFAPAIATAAVALTALLTVGKDQAADLRTQIDEILKTASSYQEYADAVKKAAAAAGMSVDITGEQQKAMGPLRATVGATGIAIDQYARSLWDSSAAANADAIAMGNIKAAMDSTKVSAEDLAGSLPQLNFRDMKAGADAANASVSELAQSELAAATAADALAAGLQGTIQEAMASYSETMASLIPEQANLTAQIEQATIGWGASSTKVMELNAKLAENQTQQAAAAAAMQEATAQMIYQQAASAVTGQSALDLARAMGVLSETDYVLASITGELKTQFGANADGMIESKSAADAYIASVALLTTAAGNLATKGQAINRENLDKELQSMQTAAAGTNVQDLVGSISQAAPGITTFAEGMKGLGEDALPAYENTDKAVGSIAKVPGVANPAATAVSGMISPLTKAAKASNDLADGIDRIKPVRVSATINIASFENAISWIKKLGLSIDNLPSSKSITITVNAVPGGGTVPPGPPPPGPRDSAKPTSAPVTLPGPVTTTADITSFQTAISWMNRLGDSIDNLPSRKTTTPTVNALSDGGTVPTTPPLPEPRTPATPMSAPVTLPGPFITTENIASFQSAISWMNRLGDSIDNLPSRKTTTPTVNAVSVGGTVPTTPPLPEPRSPATPMSAPVTLPGPFITTENIASFQSAISWMNRLGDSIDNLPSRKTIIPTVNAVSGGETVPPGPPPPGPRSPVPMSAPVTLPGPVTTTEAPVYITNNVYDPLAAAIIARQQADLLQQRIAAR